MSGAAALIDELARTGVKLSRMGDQLVVDGPEAAVTDSLIEKVRGLKPDLLRSLQGWSSEDWQAFFDGRATVAEFDGGLARAAAEAQAFECCVAEWLSRNPEPSPPGRCVGCGRRESHDAVVVPFGTGERHAWLHPECWHEWHHKRREEARQYLAAIGLDAFSRLPKSKSKRK